MVLVAFKNQDLKNLLFSGILAEDLAILPGAGAWLSLATGNAPGLRSRKKFETWKGDTVPSSPQ